ncbi:MAG TPA: 50S ribosomal protein L2 [Candidatus Nanoarchaeia archaeon]|nr:50S ribosomal protein L2 [Candidatus Nanoarchaeia archaeon]
MGKNLIQQRRGRGTLTFRSPSFRFKGAVKHYPQPAQGRVMDLVHCSGHSAPLMEVNYGNGERSLAFAPDGIKVGDAVSVGSAEIGVGNNNNNNRVNTNNISAFPNTGSVLALKDIPEGTSVHNLELNPGDGGKLVRAGGSFAKIISKSEEGIRVKLPSSKERIFLPDCRAAIGIVAGGGRCEKPFLKAGVRYMKMRAKNKMYPKVCGVSMNAVDHPFGSKCSHTKGRPTQSPRSAPPGRKVGKIAPRRTGRKR